MTIHDLINSRISQPCETSTTPEYLWELAQIEVEMGEGRWIATYTGNSIQVDPDQWLCERVACEIEPATPPIVRVSKDTIIQRVKAAGKLSELLAVIQSLPPNDRFEFDASWWFSANNPRVIGATLAIGLDPAAILAADPYLY